MQLLGTIWFPILRCQHVHYVMVSVASARSPTLDSLSPETTTVYLAKMKTFVPIVLWIHVPIRNRAV